MEGHRKPSSSMAGAAQSSPLFSGFSSSIGGSKEASMTNKHKAKSQISTSQATDHSGRKPQGSLTSRLPAHKRDTAKPLNQPEQSIESPYFGSSVHYGARDFYGSPPSSKTSKNNQNDEGSDLGNQEFATRGEWWQGSLYY